MRMSEWKMNLPPPPPPTVQNAPPPLGLFALLLKKVIFCIAYSYLLLTYYVTY